MFFNNPSAFLVSQKMKSVYNFLLLFLNPTAEHTFSAREGDSLVLGRAWHDPHVFLAAWACFDNDITSLAVWVEKEPFWAPFSKYKYIYGAANVLELQI